MAFRQENAPSTQTGKDLSAPLEGPISLLWAYQLRREHALLLTRIDSLADIVRNDDVASHVKQLSLELKAVRERLAAAEKESDSHRRELQAVQAKSPGENGIADIRLRLVDSEKHHNQKIELVRVELEKAFETKLRTQQEQTEILQSRMTEIDGRITELGGRDAAMVKDTIEDLPQSSPLQYIPPSYPLENSPISSRLRYIAPESEDVDFRKPHLIYNSNVSKKLDQRRPKAFSHANELMQEIDEDDSNMLTLRPVQRSDDTPATEFDLDAGVDTMSYARHLRPRATPEESMAMLPELPRLESHQEHSEEPALRQGAEPWEKYLAEGRMKVRSSKKRKEGAIVDAFVMGITEPGLRADCEHWLDKRVWIWEHVKAFAAQRTDEARREPSVTADPSPAPQRKHRRLKGQGDTQAVTKELARLLDHQSRPGLDSGQLFASQEPDGIRRSQRLANKNDKAIRRGNGTEQNANELPETNSRQVPTIRADLRQSANGLKSAQANIAGNQPARRQAKPSKAMQSKQTAVSNGNHESESHVQRKQVEDQVDRLEATADPDVRADAQKMHDLFPKESVERCHQALLKHNGHFDNACDWIIGQTQQLVKPKKITDVVLPSTPTPVNRSVNTFQLARIKTIYYRPDVYKTPEHRLTGRTSYKRKSDMPDGDAILKKRKVVVKRRKRGPPPMIPILPSSDIE